MRTRIVIDRDPIFNGVRIYVVREDERTGQRFIVSKIETKEHDEFTVPDHVPVVEVHHHSDADQLLQRLMDDLWNQGVRPKEIGTAGHLAATQHHLDDMRALVSKTLDVQLPKGGR